MAATNYHATQPAFHRLDISAYETGQKPDRRGGRTFAELNPDGWRRIIDEYEGAQFFGTYVLAEAYLHYD